MKRRLLLTGGAALLAGCGFQLRQAPQFVFDTIEFVEEAANRVVAGQHLGAGGDVHGHQR